MAYILDTITALTAVNDPGTLVATVWVGGGVLVLAAAARTVLPRTARSEVRPD